MIGPEKYDISGLCCIIWAMKKVTFYTKLNCHLCIDAYRLLVDAAFDMPLEIDVVDITHTHNADLKSMYATRIPVVTTPNADTELDWPFTYEELIAFLAD